MCGSRMEGLWHEKRQCLFTAGLAVYGNFKFCYTIYQGSAATALPFRRLYLVEILCVRPYPTTVTPINLVPARVFSIEFCGKPLQFPRSFRQNRMAFIYGRLQIHDTASFLDFALMLDFITQALPGKPQIKSRRDLFPVIAESQKSRRPPPCKSRIPVVH